MPQQTRKSPDQTPAMRQYQTFKERHPECVLFFRMGDFYEMFYEDAKLAARVLGVTLTQRTEGVPMAGVPYHSVESYLRRMIQSGYRVAVCDQVEEASQAKGVVKRDVTRLITPGTLTDDELLEEGRDNPIVAVWAGRPSSSGRAGEQNKMANPHGGGDSNTVYAAWAELSTGAFQVASFDADVLTDELARLGPRELLFADDDSGRTPDWFERCREFLDVVATPRPGWTFRPEEAEHTLCRQFGVARLDGFGLTCDDPRVAPAGALVAYLLETQCMAEPDRHEDHGTAAGPAPLAHLRPPRIFERSEHLLIDQASLRSLEIERTTRSQEIEGSLLGAMQDCRTAMGKRLLRQWLCYPLGDRASIEARQAMVETFVDDPSLLEAMRARLDEVQDVARIVARVGVGRGTPRDVVALGRSAVRVRQLQQLLDDRPAAQPWRDALAETAEIIEPLGEQILRQCVDAPPAHLREGGLFRDGVDQELDECRLLQRDSHDWLARYQASLVEQTGVSSLKVGYNKVFGYYIELSAANRDKAPDDWSRKQTLKNAERFITPELKDYESKVLSAEQRAITREQVLFESLQGRIAQRLDPLQRFADRVAALDVLACFARRAVRHRYVRPQIVDLPVLSIRGGRHPVLDERLGDRFVPNDVRLGDTAAWRDLPPDVSPAEDALDQTRQSLTDAGTEPGVAAGTDPNSASPTLALITGPNMAGKSTYIRQTALIVLLAHTGAFVPADQAVVGLCDRLFTRIGASDELHTGQSTFMVEMTETARICHHATERSLVILDEIGRGTSTLDGLSLAWAIAEFIADRRCRALFATHYHELTSLAHDRPNVGNLNVSVREWNDEVVFLHRILPGATDRSYGIHVAKIAGLPEPVVRRARDLMDELEVSHRATSGGSNAGAKASHEAGRSSRADDGQLSLFTEYVEHPVIEQLRDTALDDVSPRQAFDLLRQWQDELRES